MVLTNVIAGATGAVAGAASAVFVNLSALRGLEPQPEVYNTRALSVPATELLVYLTLRVWEVNDPESIVVPILLYKVPTKDHR